MPASADLNAATMGQCPSAAGQTDRPAGARSPTVIGLHAAGWLLLLCLFLPVCRGCNGAIVRPSDGLVLTPPVHVADVVGCVALLAVYGNGVCIAVLITISGCLRSPTFWWRSFVVQAAISACIGLTIVGAVLVTSHTPKAWLQQSLVFVPPLVGGITWVGLAFRYADPEQAWARVQHIWTIGAWLNLNLHCILSGALLFGYWVTLFALAGQLFAVELARHRMRHDLWDASHPTRRPQFTLGSLLAWMTILPLIFGYYQAVEPIVEWFFPEK